MGLKSISCISNYRIELVISNKSWDINKDSEDSIESFAVQMR